METYESESVASMCELQASDNGVCVVVAILGKLDEVCRGRAFRRRGRSEIKHDMGPRIPSMFYNTNLGYLYASLTQSSIVQPSSRSLTCHRECQQLWPAKHQVVVVGAPSTPG